MYGDLQRQKRGPVILILDNEFVHFPWENMPEFISDHVTRMPSFVSLIALLTWHTKMVKSQFKSGVERTGVIANICGLDNCTREECTQLKQKLKLYEGWLVDSNGSDSSLTEIQPKLQNSSLHIYGGHRRSNYKFEQASSGRTLVIDLSSDFGLLEINKNVDGSATLFNYLLEGCPAVVGNLTVSYVPEAYAVISNLFPCWAAQSEPISVRKLLVMASQATGNFGICGTPLVIYGLPLMMN